MASLTVADSSLRGPQLPGVDVRSCAAETLFGRVFGVEVTSRVIDKDIHLTRKLNNRIQSQSKVMIRGMERGSALVLFHKRQILTRSKFRRLLP